MSAYNYSPIMEFKGDLRVANAGSDNSSVARRSDVAGLSYITSIAVGSQSMLSVSGGALSVDSLLITDVTVDDTYTTLAAWINNGIPAGVKKGDFVILTAADPALTYICKVESPSSAADFALVNDGNTYTAGNGLSLSGGAFSADVGWFRTSGNVFSAGNGLSLSAGGAFAADAAWLRTDGNVFTAGAGIANSGGTLAVNLTGGTGISVSGATISGAYTAGNGLALSGAAFAADASWLRTDGNVFTAGTGISNSSGTLAVDLTGGTAIGVSGATISFNGSTSDVSEGTNQYFTQARSRASLSAGTGVSYNNGTGVISGNYAGGDGIEITGNSIAVDASFLRFSASNVSLTANQAYTVTHNLGMKLVQTAFLRTSDSQKIDLEVVYSSTTALTIKSVVNVTVDIAVSI